MSRSSKRKVYVWFTLFLMLTGLVACRRAWYSYYQQYLDQTLLTAAKNHRFADVVHLLHSGANPNAKIQPSILTSLLNSDVGDEVIMVAAADEGDSSIIKVLLDNGGNANTYTPHLQITPLMAASKKGDVNTIKLLLLHGADMNAKNFMQWTALHYAVSTGRTDVVRLLLTSGAHAKGDKSLLKIGSTPEVDNILIQAGATTK